VQSFTQKLSELAWGVAGLLMLGVFGAGLFWLTAALWGEREGTIKTDDCRTRITLKEGSPTTWFKKFTCTYKKTNKGNLMSGYCEAVETNAGTCDTVYFFWKRYIAFCGSLLLKA